MAFAVIQTGGKQYRVAEGDTIAIEHIAGAEKGAKLAFDKVLLTDDGAKSVVGTPFIDGAKVAGTIVDIGRAKTIRVVKYKAKSRYLKQNGHRQPFLKVKIEKI